MGTKAYFMVKMETIASGDGHAEAVRELEAMPEVETVETVSGEYDLIVTAAVDVPIRVGIVAKEIEAKEWVKSLRILNAEPAQPNPFLDEVCSLPGGECVRWCMQCGMCSASCPNVSQMDYSPRKIIALIRAGRRYDVLTSNTMWVCASCYLCTARCPKEVKITELMHSLERLTARHSLRNGEVSTPAMYGAFVNSIKGNGRVFEMGMMIKFYLSTLLTGKANLLATTNMFLATIKSSLATVKTLLGTIRMLPLALKLLLHGRMSLMPRKIKGAKQVRAIVETAQTLGGVQ